MTIVFAASEMVPFCKTGGLADVIGALPSGLADLGHDVHVMLPGYRVIDKSKYSFRRHAGTPVIPVGNRHMPLGISTAKYNRVAVHLLENDEYFNRAGLYGDENGDYGDNGGRFIFFSRAVIEAMKHLRIRPDIIHAHDWQAGLVIAYLKTVYRNDPFFGNTGSLFTIHNLGYQGLFPYDVFAQSGIPPVEYHWTKLEFYNKVSFIKGGIVYADAVSTVSETYADEITGRELGFGLDGLFTSRKHDLYGIVNGIDYEVWNPSTDAGIPARYSPENLSGKEICRDGLLRACGLKAGKTVPVVAMISRLDDQKGFDILESSVGKLMNFNIRLVILGTGTKDHQETMIRLTERYPRHIHIALMFDNSLAHLIYAGADAFLMPSRYEPCGLGQLIAMRYGTLPVVRATGGLADTVIDEDRYPGSGTGFSFGNYSSDALVDAVSRAVRMFRSPGRQRWQETVKRAMTADFSWKKSAVSYQTLYERIRNSRC
ncbi:glycogen synthase GlgA [bacterium]|nr:glycogen synthase GlgA [bacterium]